MPDLMRPVRVEDVWLESAATPPRLAPRLALVALVLGCVFAVFFIIGHAVAGGSAQSEQPAGTLVGNSQATIPARLKDVAALGPLEVPAPKPAPTSPAPKPASTPREAAPPSAEPVHESEPRETTPPPEVHAQPAPAPKPAPTPPSGATHSEHTSSGGSFDSSG
jgi:outer membrane biosynthesis protein TonB